jgi:uncharacterized protein
MTELFLREDFDGPTMDPRLTWLHPPGKWLIDGRRSVLIVEPDAKTDFWQKTHYGFEADDGHCLLATVTGDVVVATEVGFRPVHQYDQAGLIVRISPSCWLKASVEYEPDGPSRLGAVVTNAGYSDWSTQDVRSDRRTLRLRIRREGCDYVVEHSPGGGSWSQIRLAHLHEDRGGAVACGLYACSPTGAGFVAEFESLVIESGRVSNT